MDTSIDDIELDVDMNDIPQVDSEYLDAVKLRKFYDEFFPFDLIIDWLTINYDTTKETKQDYYSKREFSTRIEAKGKVIVFRNKSFPTVEEEIKVDDLKKFVMGSIDEFQMTQFVPIKMDIGPVYSREPIKMQQYADYKPVSRELVFDIDIDDYNDIRVCCNGVLLCKKCWGFLGVTAKFLDMYLREAYGFNQILYVYSGRRGMHVWVSDSAASDLSKELRQRILSYSRPSFDAIQTPILEKAFNEIFLPFFENRVLDDQLIFDDEAQYKKFLERLPMELKIKKGSKYIAVSVRKVIEEEISNFKNIPAIEKWEKIKNYLVDELKAIEYLYRIVFDYTYPRFDEPVTIGLNHLLKSPFCIHPLTKKLCIPLDINHIDDYDPNDIPTIQQILDQNNNSSNNNNSSPNISPNKSVGSRKKGKPLNHSFNYYRSYFKNYVNSMKLLKSASNDNPLSF